METPERAHFKESLPAGRLALLRAKKTVFPRGQAASASLSEEASGMDGDLPVCMPIKTDQAL